MKFSRQKGDARSLNLDEEENEKNIKNFSYRVTLTGCWLDWENIFSFENRFQTTEDGFVYYVNSSNRLYLIEVPDSEEITIPEYIDGYKVIQLGKHIGFFTSETKEVDGSHVKKITIQHYAIYHAVDFHNAEVCIILDYLYCEPYIYE